jgi:methyltransferase (TIGR00027 family)
MRANESSSTARGAAALRAAHLVGDPPYVFEDPYALALAGEEWRSAHERGELRETFRMLGLERLEGQLVGRARWAEDALERSIDRGISQYVIVGAGLDSFVLRRSDLLKRLRVFELDHPASQNEKRAQLEALGFEASDAVEWVEADLEITPVGVALADSSFRRDVPSFFAWLGVVTYLSEEAIFATLRSIRECSAPGSLVAMDYPVHPKLLDEEFRLLFERVRDGSAQVGEPRRATHDPEQLRARVGALGYETIEDLSYEDHVARYFAGRSDGLLPYPQQHLALFRTL